ncbi:uncharacterized protein LOC121677115 isoform X2 [Arvicola amphibius]|uniref:uncharacterized protein LOC121677115 isoform X2 n=1 Tax=Arvicola amphibius TaxID=1047088 RepID=UPI001C0A0B02|nr:uncharacterized protein LOC121677115 isoform X2 [Arvicola amphibius]
MWRRTPQKKDHPLVTYPTLFPNSPPPVGQKTSVTHISDSLPGQTSGVRTLTNHTHRLFSRSSPVKTTQHLTVDGGWDEEQLTVLQGTAHHCSEVEAAGTHPQLESKELGCLYSTPILHFISPWLQDLEMALPTGWKNKPQQAVEIRETESIGKVTTPGSDSIRCPEIFSPEHPPAASNVSPRVIPEQVMSTSLCPALTSPR